MRMRQLSRSQIAKYQSRLLELRARLRHDVDALQSAAIDGQGAEQSRMSIHMAEVAGTQFESECSLRLREEEQQILDEVQAALVRIEQGVFGICEATGQPIACARLNAIPYARYCISYARQDERENCLRQSRPM